MINVAKMWLCTIHLDVYLNYHKNARLLHTLTEDTPGHKQHCRQRVTYRIHAHTPIRYTAQCTQHIAHAQFTQHTITLLRLCTLLASSSVTRTSQSSEAQTGRTQSWTQYIATPHFGRVLGARSPVASNSHSIAPQLFLI